MKKLLLFIMFTITATLSVQAIEYNKKTKNILEEKGVFFGNPFESKIIGSKNLYVIIYNPTALAITVMHQEAIKYCRTKLGNDNYTSKFMQLLGNYTAYFSCEKENKIDEFNLLDQEKKCIEDRVFENNIKNCLDLNKKNIKIINAIELQTINEEKHTTLDFIYSVRSKFFDQIEEFEQASENNRKKKEYAIVNQQIQKHINICKNYTFVEGSKEFSQCLLQLISLNINVTERGNLLLDLYKKLK